MSFAPLGQFGQLPGCGFARDLSSFSGHDAAFSRGIIRYQYIGQSNITGVSHDNFIRHGFADVLFVRSLVVDFHCMQLSVYLLSPLSAHLSPAIQQQTISNQTYLSPLDGYIDRSEFNMASGFRHKKPARRPVFERVNPDQCSRGTINKATMLMILINGFTAGPAVSL